MPRLRFTIRQMMIAVAITCVVMAVEGGVAKFAIHFLSVDCEVPNYTLGQVAVIWGYFQIPLVMIAVFIWPILAGFYSLAKGTIQRRN